ncbi:unnamed protein product, partial [Prorocentrum cordatum]
GGETRQLAFTKRPRAFSEQPCLVRFLQWGRFVDGLACRGGYSVGGCVALYSGRWRRRWLELRAVCCRCGRETCPCGLGRRSGAARRAASVAAADAATRRLQRQLADAPANAEAPCAELGHASLGGAARPLRDLLGRSRVKRSSRPTPRALAAMSIVKVARVLLLGSPPWGPAPPRREGYLGT